MPAIDLLLKGAHVIDAANRVDRKADVAIAGNRIHSVADDSIRGLRRTSSTAAA